MPRNGQDKNETPSYRIAAIVGLCVFCLYAVTLAPTTAMWDASEYITAAYTLGIPHPPGNPFFVLLGRVASLFPFGSVAVRVNALAAICSAFSAAIWFLVTERVLIAWSAERWTRLAAAAAAAILGATAFTVWNQSVVNEKVYTVSLAFFAIVSWLTVRWCDDPDGRRSDQILVVIAYLIGLGYTNHPAGFLVGPAVAVAVMIRRPRTIYRWKLLVALVGALVFGLTPFAVEPIRAAWHPALNEGEPTGCTTTIGLSCTFSQTTATRLMANINRDQYGKPDLSVRQAPFSAQVGMWWLYFRWQWLRDVHGQSPFLQFSLAVLFLALGVAGGFAHWRYERASFWFFGPLVLTVTFALIYYMNFKYGASQASDFDVPREVRDRDYFYLWSYSTWSVWASIGIAALWKWSASRLARLGSRRWLITSPVLALACIPLLGNWRAASRAGETATREWAHDLLNSVEPYGILVTLGDNDTFPLWYAQEVEGVRKDVTVAVTSLLATDWYAKGLLKRPHYEYDAAHGPAVYRALAGPPPVQPILSLSDAALDALPEYLANQNTQVFAYEGIRAVIDPKKLDYQVLTRGDLLVLQFIKDNYGVRPVYIARTSGGYVQALGLEQYAIAQGLAFKIAKVPVSSTETLIEVPGLGHVDVDRTRSLWNEYGAPQAIISRGDWLDRPSIGIPYLYIVTSRLLAELETRRGDTAAAGKLREQSRALIQATHTEDVFSQSR